MQIMSRLRRENFCLVPFVKGYSEWEMRNEKHKELWDPHSLHTLYSLFVAWFASFGGSPCADFFALRYLSNAFIFPYNYLMKFGYKMILVIPPLRDNYNNNFSTRGQEAGLVDPRLTLDAIKYQRYLMTSTGGWIWQSSPNNLLL